MFGLGRKALAASFVALALLGCSKSGGSSKVDPASATPSDAGAGDASPAEAAVDPNAPRVFAGSYAVEPAEIYIPSTKAYARVKQAKDDPDKLIGEGTVSITITADGKVTGTIDSGPAAPAVLEGMAKGDDVRGSVRRSDPADDGLTGTLQARLDDAKLEGKLSLADANAAIVRAGTLSLAKKK